MTLSPTRLARELFAPLADDYERWARLLSLGQDSRWRRSMVDAVQVKAGEIALDVAAGTGSITRLLQSRGAEVISLDQSEEMLGRATTRGAVGVVAIGERLPFADQSFDIVTFGYLLRYVGDVEECMAELTRVLRPGGRIGMIEFGLPRGVWRPLWWLYTRTVLPLAGLLAGKGWFRVGRFLGPSIEEFTAAHPPGRLAAVWRETGLVDVGLRHLSLGGGLVMWGRRGEEPAVGGVA